MSQLTKDIFIQEVRERIQGYMDSSFPIRIIMGPDYALYDAENLSQLETPTYSHLTAMAVADIVASKKYINIPENTISVYRDLQTKLGADWRVTPMINAKEETPFDWSHVNAVLLTEDKTFFQVTPFAIAFAQLYLAGELPLLKEGEPEIDYSEFKTAMVDELMKEIADLNAEEYQTKLEAKHKSLAERYDQNHPANETKAQIGLATPEQNESKETD